MSEAHAGDATWVISWLNLAQQLIEEKYDLLTELDREIGDGDHGDNMRRGLRAVTQDLTPAAKIGDMFQAIAMKLMTTVGGASGPLYATAFLRAAKVSDVSHLEPAHVVSMISAMVDGVGARGHAKAGDKTMLDALDGALRGATGALEEGADFCGIWRAASMGADAGAAATAQMLAQRGRASYLGARSEGHRDPGAQSTALIFQAAYAACLDHETDPSNTSQGDPERA